MDNRIFARLNGDREIQIDEQFDLQSVLWFKLGSEDYAIKVDSVQTVLDEFSLTPVPNTTTSAAVTRYLVAIQAMAAVIRTRRLQCRTVA